MQDAYLVGDTVMYAMLERCGGKLSSHPDIQAQLPHQMVCVCIQAAMHAATMHESIPLLVASCCTIHIHHHVCRAAGS